MVSIEKYIEFKKGLIPLILSVPHGGSLKCENIPNRKKGVLGIDKGTIKLAHEFISYFKKSYENYDPSYIIAKVHRSKIDINRPEYEAFSANSRLAKQIYHMYHDKIKELILYNIESFGVSTLIDIHGFEKHKRPPGYRDVEIILGTNNLASFFPNPLPLKERAKNLRGEIIKSFLKLNIPIAPGHPRRKEYVLKGGYITRKYGASEIEKSKAMQLEFSDRIRIFDKDLRKKVMNALAEVFLTHISKSMQIY